MSRALMNTVVVGIALLAASLGGLATAASAQVVVVTAEVFVSGVNPCWMDTEVDVMEGDLIYIEATGVCCAISPGVGCYTPDGLSVQNEPYTINSNAAVSTVAFMGLCSAVGQPPVSNPDCGCDPGGSYILLDDGWDVNGTGISGCDTHVPGVQPGIFGPGFIGSRFCTRAPEAGRIYLIVNDDPFNCYGDNSGEFTVSLLVLQGLAGVRDGGDDHPQDGIEPWPAYPNPAKGSTALRFELPTPSQVWLEVLDVTGRVVRTLSDGRHYPAGVSEIGWDGRDGRGIPLPSGQYFYRVEAGELKRETSIVLIR